MMATTSVGAPVLRYGCRATIQPSSTEANIVNIIF